MPAPSRVKSPLVQRFAYACGIFGHSVFYVMLATYFMMFVTSNLFHSDNPSQDSYMIGFVTTVILALRIIELLSILSSGISSIRPRRAGVVSSHGSC